MVVIVCGGLEYEDRSAVFAVLDRVHARQGISRVVHGGAHGADALAEEWAHLRGIDTCTVDEYWRQEHAPASAACAGRMAALKAQLCIAFPGGGGTLEVARRAANRGIEVWQPCG